VRHMVRGLEESNVRTLGVSRRRFLTGTGALASLQLASTRLPFRASSLPSQDQSSADYTLHIKSSLIEIAHKRIISAITYGGQFPGPYLASRKADRSLPTFTTTQIGLSSCIGTVKGFPPT